MLNILNSNKPMSGATTVDGLARDGGSPVGGVGVELEKQGFFEYVPYTTNNMPATSDYFAPITPKTLETLNNLDALLLPDDQDVDDVDDDDDFDLDGLDLDTAKIDEINTDDEQMTNDNNRDDYDANGITMPTAVMAQSQDAAPFMFVPVEMAVVDTAGLFMLSPKHSNNPNDPWYVPAFDPQHQQQQTTTEGTFTFVPMVAGVTIIGALAESDGDSKPNSGTSQDARKESQQKQAVDEEGKPTAFTVQQIATMPTATAKKGTITVSKEVEGQKTFRFVPEDKTDDKAYDFVPVMQSQQKAVLPKSDDPGLTSSLTNAFSSVMPFAGKLFGGVSNAMGSLTKAILEESDDDDDDDDDSKEKHKKDNSKQLHRRTTNTNNTPATNLAIPTSGTNANLKHHHHSQPHPHHNNTHRQHHKSLVTANTDQRKVVAVAARDSGGDMMVCTEDGQQLLVTVPIGVSKGQTFVVNF